MIGWNGKRVGGFGEEGEPQREVVDAGDAARSGCRGYTGCAGRRRWSGGGRRR